MTQISDVKFFTFKEHVKTHDLWKGSREPCNLNMYIWDKGTYVLTPVQISPALIKCVDEIIVNACDHWVRSKDLPETALQVNRISVKIARDGTIEVYNNGNGIPTGEVDVRGKMMNCVEALITQEYGGSNFGKTSSTGGVNGVGIKVVMYECEEFKVTTAHKHGDQVTIYQQNFIQGEASAPKINTIPAKEYLAGRELFTRFTLKLMYSNFGTTADKAVPILESYIKLRLEQINTYIHTLGKCNITFGNEPIVPKTCKQLAMLFGFTADEMHDISRGEICVSLRSKKPMVMSIINGIHVTNGAHVELFKNVLTDAILPDGERELLSKKSTKGMDEKARDIREKAREKRNHIKLLLKKHITYFDALQVQSAIFDAQVKDSFKLNPIQEKEYLAKISNIPKKVIAELSKQVTESLRGSDIKKEIKAAQEALEQLKRKCVVESAGNAGKGKPCYLFIPEGNSADQLVEALIGSGKTIITRSTGSLPLNRTYYGSFIIQGVPHNVRKKAKKVEESGEEYVLPDIEMLKNGAFPHLMRELGLEFGVTPDPSKLRYSGVIIATDQDVDGIGHICSLILVFFLTYFPNLVASGFVKRINTPIIRAYPRGGGRTPKNFYFEEEFDKWIEEHGIEQLHKQWDIQYFKGLATHDADKDVRGDILPHFYELLYTYKLDDFAHEMAGKMYGKDTTSRKKELLDSTKHILSAKEYAEGNLLASEHFKVFTKQFQLEFIHRKLKDFCDGMIPSQRKAFAVIRRVRKPRKVIEYTGQITSEMKYEHGDGPMHGVITYMAQKFIGSNNIPLLSSKSIGTGSRKSGRKGGAARYLRVTYNPICDLLFPREDDADLQYTYTEMEKCEPVRYVPVLPMAVLETSMTPAPGWKQSIWARSLHATVALVRELVTEMPPIEKFRSRLLYSPDPLLGANWEYAGLMYGSVEKDGYTKEIEWCKHTVLTGKGKKSLKITQLPYGMWITTFYTLMNEKKVLYKGNYEPISDTLEYILVPPAEAWDFQGKYSPTIPSIIEWLGLYQFHDTNLNITGPAGTIRIYRNYFHIICEWFFERKKAYELRYKRILLLAKAKLALAEGRVKYISEHNANKISLNKLSAVQRVSCLTNAGYTSINETMVKNANNYTTSALEAGLYHPGNYSYIENLKVKNFGSDGLEKAIKKLQDAKKALAEISNKTISTIWLEEIDKFVNTQMRV